MSQATFGSLRRCDGAEVELVLANGVYITFRLERLKKPVLRNLIELRRSRRYAKPGDAIPLKKSFLRQVRRGAFDALMLHREKMRLPPPREQRRHPCQLSFVFD